MLEHLLHPDFRGALLQQRQQTLAGDAAESMPAAAKAAPADVDGNVIPMVEAREDGGVGFEVRGAEVFHGLVGKHHAPAEGVVRTVALVDFHARRWQRLAQQNGAV
jgi:hypothetical protein